MTTIDKTDNTQIFNNIQSLQTIEKEMFDTLETNKNLTDSQKTEIIEKINAISTMRINLYNSLYNTSSGVNKTNLNDVNQSIVDQSSAIKIEEQNLNRFKKEMMVAEEAVNNKIRLIEINNYYSQKYTDHAKIIKILFVFGIIILIMTLLFRKGFLSSSIYYALLIIVGVIFAYYFWINFLLIYKRDNMNYQEIQWNFDPNSMKTTNTVVTTDLPDPWFTLPKTCIGEYCCAPGSVYDSSMNQCIVSATNGTETFKNYLNNSRSLGYSKI